MGKGTKHKSDWKETTLQVVVDAKRFFCHSVKIMGNDKVFAPTNDFRGMTLMRAFDLAYDIYEKVWTANTINVSKTPDLAGERLTLQRAAILSCRQFLALMELMKMQFHLRSQKYWNWKRMLLDLGIKTSAWNKSDAARYAKKDDLVKQDGGRLIPSAEPASQVS